MATLFKLWKPKLSKKHKKSKPTPTKEALSHKSSNLSASSSSPVESGLSVSVGYRMKDNVIGRSKSMLSFNKLANLEDFWQPRDDSQLRSLSDLSSARNSPSDNQTPIQTISNSAACKRSSPTLTQSSICTDNCNTTRSKLSPKVIVDPPVCKPTQSSFCTDNGNMTSTKLSPKAIINPTVSKSLNKTLARLSSIASGHSDTKLSSKAIVDPTVSKSLNKTLAQSSSCTSGNSDTKLSPKAIVDPTVSKSPNKTLAQPSSIASGNSDTTNTKLSPKSIVDPTVSTSLNETPAQPSSCTSGNSETRSTKLSLKAIDPLSSTSSTSKWDQFLHSLSSSDSTTLYQILKSIRNDQIKRFQESFGFRLDLLLYVAIEFSLSNPTWTDKQLLSEFWRLNEKRLFDNSFFLWLESESQNILGVENRISDLLKVRTKDCLKCAICRHNIVSVLFLPCGHIVICGECSASNPTLVCPACGTNIDETHNVFF